MALPSTGCRTYNRRQISSRRLTMVLWGHGTAGRSPAESSQGKTEIKTRKQRSITVSNFHVHEGGSILWTKGWNNNIDEISWRTVRTEVMLPTNLGKKQQTSAQSHGSPSPSVASPAPVSSMATLRASPESNRRYVDLITWWEFGLEYISRFSLLHVLLMFSLPLLIITAE